MVLLAHERAPARAAIRARETVVGIILDALDIIGARCASRRDANAGLNSKKCTRPARQRREIRARCFYGR